MADSLFRIWKENKEKEGLVQISFFAQLILGLEPNDEQAQALRAMEREYYKKKGRPLQIFAALLVLSMFIGIYLYWDHQQRLRSPLSETYTTQSSKKKKKEHREPHKEKDTPVLEKGDKFW